MDYLGELKAKIRLLHGCDATHRQSVPVKEVFKDRIIWSGTVEVFDLYGHTEAKRCYAWGYPDKKEPDKLDVIAVLEIPPVVSPETAVRAGVTIYEKTTGPFPPKGMT